MTRRSPYARTARRKWPRAAWILGDGQYASVAYCRVTTVILFKTRAEAEEAKDFIDRLACGGGCCRNHEIINMQEAS